MRPVISSVLVATCAALLTGCAGGSSPTSATAPSTPATQAGIQAGISAGISVTPPAAPAGESVIASLTGQGSSRSARDITTDGSYTAYLVCRGGEEVVVVSTASKSDTPVPCTGYASRLRYLTDGHADSLTVQAASGQAWALTVVDATLDS
ncbi:hypothetical protein GCM10009721_12030 [Terrabacter tumescens]|uniref:Lipoprotein n=1 Tax=Terrabacter tumescens TaxID=60443 RepID=A0ABQ2HSZ6_9MICO|nr:hypothetical protein [Terrabacter tumescens]GGM88549.1 hypothetical protein GCM10009721_12030 [Terrabacter tumescens]